MANLDVPIIVVVTGEGGSGGALAIGVGDRVLILENAYYSVISPESCASIIFRDSSRAEEAAGILRFNAQSLIELGVVDEIIPEPVGGAHKDATLTAQNLKDALVRHLNHLLKLTPSRLLDERYEKFRRIGFFTEV
jgi:acetyl-CoA carboxylase carboxyl transferase subunit alpha